MTEKEINDIWLSVANGLPPINENTLSVMKAIWKAGFLAGIHIGTDDVYEECEQIAHKCEHDAPYQCPDPICTAGKNMAMTIKREIQLKRIAINDSL